MPVLSKNDFRDEVILQSSSGKRVIAFFGNRQDGGTRPFCAMAGDDNSEIAVASVFFGKDEKSFESLTGLVPSLSLFEREFQEETGIIAEGHPWAKPVRYPYNRSNPENKMENYPFYTMESEELHEVGVGPVHAGVIEPGHFRFICRGEEILHLEIQLGYQHRGVEDLIVRRHAEKNGVFQTRTVESVSGDSVIAHASAYCSVIESLKDVSVPQRAHAVRAVAQELERIAMHLASLSGIATDIAHLAGGAFYGARRTTVINTLLKLCGSRFGRGLLVPGGVCFDIDDASGKEMKNSMNVLREDIEEMSGAFFSSANVLSRLEKTGVVSRPDAVSAGLVGLAARASGVAVDIRADHPYGHYRVQPVHKLTMQSGDVFARAYLRYLEITQSIRFINEALGEIPDGSAAVPDLPQTPGAPDSLVLSMTEGHRGGVVHAAITDARGNIVRYKIKDPSFNNWRGLALAVRGNGISDFPVCNKSFDLSYCGFDL